MQMTLTMILLQYFHCLHKDVQLVIGQRCPSYRKFNIWLGSCIEEVYR